MSWKNIPLLSKILLLIGALGVLSLGATLYSTSIMRDIDNRYSSMLEKDATAAIALARANRGIAWYARSVNRLILADTNDENAAVMVDLEAGRSGFKAGVEKSLTLMTARKSEIEAVSRQFAIVEQSCAETIRLALDEVDPSATKRAKQSLAANCTPQIKQIIPMVATLVDSVVAGLDKASTDASSTARSAIILAYILIGSGLCIVLALAALLTVTGVTRPLNRLLVLMAEIGRGNFGTKTSDTDRKDEIGTIAKAIEAFRLGLGEAETMRLAQEAIKADEIARTNRRATAAAQFASRMHAIAQEFTKSSDEVADAAKNLSATAEETSRQAQAVSGAAEEASTNVQTIAASTEEMTASSREVASQVTRSMEVANLAAREATRTESDVKALSEAAAKIGEVVGLISSIAGQTNLLALNATIEAARAGEAGRGFAVVASEVKQLAAETAKATDEIGSKVAEIQAATNRTVGSIEKIVGTVTQIQEISTIIASAIEEQGIATGEISANSQRAAEGAGEVTNNINGVGRAAEMTGAASTQLMSLSAVLSGKATELRREVGGFVDEMKAA